MLSIKNLSKTYGQKTFAFTALKDVSFDVAKGTSVAIVGKSGSGKSTLMHALSGLDRPDSGQVLLNGRNILELPGRELDRFRAQEMGFVFQSFFVSPHETCLQNVMLPLEINRIPFMQRREKAAQALERVELTDKLQVKAQNLSGGQKQRLAIARAIVHDPQVIFADEPTGNLDSHSSQTIISLLFELQRQAGVTLFIVTHDEDLAQLCDVRIRIKDGQIEELAHRKTP